MLCLIDKSLQFVKPEIQYEVAITCTFGRKLRMSTISAVHTCTYTANMHLRVTLRKCRVLRYIFVRFFNKNAANSVYLCVL